MTTTEKGTIGVFQSEKGIDLLEMTATENPDSLKLSIATGIYLFEMTTIKN